jgi:hypothetical protein
MRKKNKLLSDDSIDLLILAQVLWKSKYLIISISLIFMLLTFIHVKSKDNKLNEYFSDIKVKMPSEVLFLDYNSISDKNRKNFITDFNLNILSTNNLVSFIEQNTKIDEFKNFLKANNLTSEIYFYERFKKLRQDKPNTYRLTFYNILNGEEFLNDYVEFTKNITIKEFINNLNLSIQNKIDTHEHNLNIAKEINQENPVIQSLSGTANAFFFYAETPYYKGAKVLIQEIIYLKKILKDLENESFDYNPILDSASTKRLYEIKDGINTIHGLIFGLILSLVIIFFRELASNKNL